MSDLIFVSTMLYSASRKLGRVAANNELMRQVQGLAQAGAAALNDLDDANWWGYPAAVTIARCALLGEVQVHVNAGATVIGKGRSIAACDFLAEQRARVWVSVDDDVVVSCDALACMVEQCLREPSIVVAPCVLRDTTSINIVDPGPVLLEPSKGCVLQRIGSGGFGCVAFSRSVIDRAYYEAGPENDWTDDEGIKRRAVFRDRVMDGKWFTEDLEFFEALRGYEQDEPPKRKTGVYAVRRGRTTHNGQPLDLATLEAVKVERSPLVV